MVSVARLPRLDVRSNEENPKDNTLRRCPLGRRTGRRAAASTVPPGRSQRVPQLPRCHAGATGRRVGEVDLVSRRTAGSPREERNLAMTLIRPGRWTRPKMHHAIQGPDPALMRNDPGKSIDHETISVGDSWGLEQPPPVDDLLQILDLVDPPTERASSSSGPASVGERTRAWSSVGKPRRSRRTNVASR